MAGEEELKKLAQQYLREASIRIELLNFKTFATGKQLTRTEIYEILRKDAFINQLVEQGYYDTEVICTQHIVMNFRQIADNLGLHTSDSILLRINPNKMKALISEVWCSDGKQYSKRIWHHQMQLRNMLEKGLVENVVEGKSTSELKKTLMEEFSVSYHRADTLLRTELAHIETTSTQYRYKEYNIEKWAVLVTDDERTCPTCAEMDGKEFDINEQVVPLHPACRCCMVPVLS